MSKYNLTSTVVNSSPEGVYSYPYKAVLIPHEAMRREMLRAKHAIDNFDPWKHSWKADYLNEWYNGFFLPLMQNCHLIGKTIFLPYCEKCSISMSNKLFKSFKSQLKRLIPIGEIIHDIYLTTRLHEFQTLQSLTKLKNEVSEVQTLYNNWLQHEYEILNESEQFWPYHIDQLGVKMYLDIESKFITAGINDMGKPFRFLLASILASMGSTSYYQSPELGWANNSLIEEFISSIPNMIRTFSLTKWMHKYEYYYQLIIAVADPLIEYQHEIIDTTFITNIIYTKYPAISRKKLKHSKCFFQRSSNNITSTTNNTNNTEKTKLSPDISPKHTKSRSLTTSILPSFFFSSSSNASTTSSSTSSTGNPNIIFKSPSSEESDDMSSEGHSETHNHSDGHMIHTLLEELGPDDEDDNDSLSSKEQQSNMTQDPSIQTPNEPTTTHDDCLLTTSAAQISALFQFSHFVA